MYHKPKHYTDEELLAAKLADLRTDISCAVRDGLHDYANDCRRRYATLLLVLPDKSV
jgi:hypothetical protein